MLKLAASLWSADLANLAAEVKRVEPYVDRFHCDVADGHYVKLLLFSPDLVAALRPLTALPFEVHLITLDPRRWIEPFVQAGADAVIFYPDTVDDPLPVIEAIHAHGKQAGVSLRVEDPIATVEPYLERLDLVTIMGTYMGVKGVGMDPSVPGKLAALREVIARRGLSTQIEADGGIRRETVPLIHRAGADSIVPGSLLFGGDPAALRHWLQEL